MRPDDFDCDFPPAPHPGRELFTGLLVALALTVIAIGGAMKFVGWMM